MSLLWSVVSEAALELSVHPSLAPGGKYLSGVIIAISRETLPAIIA